MAPLSDGILAFGSPPKSNELATSVATGWSTFVAMRLAFVGGTLGAFALMLGAQTAAGAGNNAVQTDPSAGSPAGVIYQIPLDNARRDAAPVLHVGSHGGPGSPGSSSDPSSIHSENGFGSASSVPGVSPAALRIGAGVPAGAKPGSTWPTYLLIAVFAVAAIGAGALAKRRYGPQKRPPGA